MKHYMIEIDYRISIEEIGERVNLHRAYLQTGFDAGLLLISGPKNPRVGGIVIARAESLEEITAFFAQDPYVLHGLADYRFVEFNPVKYAPILSDWIG